MAITWAQSLKRVFNIDIETCRESGGAMKVIACIEDPVVIRKILNHLMEKGEYQDALRLPERRGPPQTRLLDRKRSHRHGPFHGLQLWLVLPEALEEIEPEFCTTRPRMFHRRTLLVRR